MAVVSCDKRTVSFQKTFPWMERNAHNGCHGIVGLHIAYENQTANLPLTSVSQTFL